MKLFFEKVNPVFVKSVKLLLAASCLNPWDENEREKPVC